jgi:hypothetical protein
MVNNVFPIQGNAEPILDPLLIRQARLRTALENRRKAKHDNYRKNRLRVTLMGEL